MLAISAGKERFGFFAMFILLFIHISACLWILITSYEGARQWLTVEIDDAAGNSEIITNAWQKYFLSLYFITQTITTVGYGDINPTNTFERCFVIILMMVGVMGFGFASGSLSSIIMSSD